MMHRKALMVMLATGIIFPSYGYPEAKEVDEQKKKKDAVSVQETKRKDSQADDKKKKKWGVIPFGFPFYSPDTSGAVAFALVLYHNPDPDDPTRKPDEFTLGGTYTLRNQMALKLDSTMYFHRDDFKLIASVSGANYPQDFWGVGPNTRDFMKEKYTPVSVTGEPGFQFKIINNLYIGPTYHISYIETWRKKRGKHLALDIIPGSDGTMASGGGFNINWDSRDSTFYPHQGFYVDLRALMYRRELGSEYNFTRIELDFRTFIRLYQEMVLALQLNARMSFGTVPFLLMPQIGGMERMRGYPDGRYMDKNCIIAQLEFRFPIVWRFGGVLFGSAGTVAPRLDRIDPLYFRYAWGPGLRFTVDKDEHINFRLDVGFDDKLNPSFYFFIKEAF